LQKLDSLSQNKAIIYKASHRRVKKIKKTDERPHDRFGKLIFAARSYTLNIEE
jgi:hypothetical protein